MFKDNHRLLPPCPVDEDKKKLVSFWDVRLARRLSVQAGHRPSETVGLLNAAKEALDLQAARCLIPQCGGTMDHHIAGSNT